MSNVSVFPGTLAQALQSTDIYAGDRLLLRTGTYTGNYVCLLQGTAEKRIEIRPYPGESPVIEGGLTLGNGSGDDKGSYIDVRNLHIKQTPVSRGAWDAPENSLTLPLTVEVMAHHTRLINNIIHDGGVGIGHWTSAPGSVIYGNIVYNNGWADVTGGAQSIYIQNQGATKTVKHNIFGPAFKTTLSCYAKGGIIENIDFLENVMFVYQSSPLIGGYLPIDAIKFDDNHIKNGGLTLGYISHQNHGVEILRNRIHAPDRAIACNWWETPNIQNNVFISNGELYGFSGAYPTDQNPMSWVWDNNTYHYTGGYVYPFSIDGVGFYSWENWKTTVGVDANSTYDTSLPATNEVFVYANEYPDANDSRRGIVVIWNWEGSNSVSVDLSALSLSNGTYRWRQAQDPLSDTDTFVYDGSAVSFGMTGHTAATPTAWEAPLLASQFPTFGCFVIEAA